MRFELFKELILSIPKTIYFNFHYFPIKTAIVFPVIISRKIKLKSLDGEIILPNYISTGIIKIGFSGSYALGT